MRYHARWVLPITRPPIEDGTVAESDGVITYVGPRSDAPPGQDYDLGEAILLPGLVNTHTHLELTAMRGFLEDCRFAEWIDKLRQSRSEVMDQQALLDSARFGIVEGLEAGITTYADTCSSGVVMQAMRDAGVRGVMYQEVFGPGSFRGGDRDARAGRTHRGSSARGDGARLPRRVTACSLHRLRSAIRCRGAVRQLAPAAAGDAYRRERAGVRDSDAGRGGFCGALAASGNSGLATREITDCPAGGARRSRARPASHPLRPLGRGRHRNHGAAALLGRALPRIERQVRARHRLHFSR